METADLPARYARGVFVPRRTERRQPRQHQQGMGLAGQALLTALVYDTVNGCIIGYKYSIVMAVSAAEST